MFDQAPDAKVPRRGIESGHLAVVQHGPLEVSDWPGGSRPSARILRSSTARSSRPVDVVVERHVVPQDNAGDRPRLPGPGTA